MPAPGSMGEAYLTINAPEENIHETIHLPPLTSIEVAHYTSLTELPTVIMGFRNNFIMDLGNTQKISLTMKRINPDPYNDNGDMEEWSNGKWYRFLESAMDYWQNFGRSSSNLRTGGFHLTFIPSDTSLAPMIDKNVFLNGSLSLQYSTTYIVVQMNLTVARMEGGDAQSGNMVTIRLHSGFGDTYTAYAAADMTTDVPGIPPDWDDVNPGYVCTGWSFNPSASTLDLRLGGQTVWEMREEPYDLYAYWVGPKFVYVRTTAGSETITVPGTIGSSTEVSSMQVYLVGGGGGAGGSGFRGMVSAVYQNPGGGGGAGEVYFDMLETASGRQYTVTVGSGGSAGANHSQWVSGDGDPGGDGGRTTLIGNGLNIVARGGEGGDGGTHGSTGSPRTTYGGIQYFYGGNTRYGSWGGDGESGSTGAGTGQGGEGWDQEKAIDARIEYVQGHGAGGGASGLDINFSVNGHSYEYQSKGGNGGGYWYNNSTGEGGTTAPTSPEYGGGGASGLYNDGSTAGADGLVVIIYY